MKATRTASARASANPRSEALEANALDASRSAAALASDCSARRRASSSSRSYSCRELASKSAVRTPVGLWSESITTWELSRTGIVLPSTLRAERLTQGLSARMPRPGEECVVDLDDSAVEGRGDQPAGRGMMERLEGVIPRWWGHGR